MLHCHALQVGAVALVAHHVVAAAACHLHRANDVPRGGGFGDGTVQALHCLILWREIGRDNSAYVVHNSPWVHFPLSAARYPLLPVPSPSVPCYQAAVWWRVCGGGGRKCRTCTGKQALTQADPRPGTCVSEPLRQMFPQPTFPRPARRRNRILCPCPTRAPRRQHSPGSACISCRRLHLTGRALPHRHSAMHLDRRRHARHWPGPLALFTPGSGTGAPCHTHACGASWAN